MSAGARRGGGERERRGGGSTGPQFAGTAGVCCPENCGNVSALPKRDTRPPGTLQSAAQSQTPTASCLYHIPQNERFETVKGETLTFSLGKVGFLIFVTGNIISFKKIIAPAFLGFWAS